MGGDLEEPPSYKFGGNVEQPEFGCEVDRLPVPCNLLSTIVRGFNVTGIGVRTQGSETRGSFINSSSGLFSVRRYDRYRVEVNGVDTSQSEDGRIVIDDNTHLVGTYFTASLSAFAEMAFAQIQTVRLPTNEHLKTGLKTVRDRNDGKCGEFLDKLRSNLGIKEKFEDLFEALIKKYNDSKGKKGGIAYVENLMSSGISINDSSLPADGEYPYNGKDVYGKKRNSSVVLKIRPEYNGSVQVNGYVNDLIHELIHYAGIKGHKEFADAAFAASDGKDAVPTKPTIKGYGMDETYSKYFDKLYAKYCR